MKSVQLRRRDVADVYQVVDNNAHTILVAYGAIERYLYFLFPEADDHVEEVYQGDFEIC